MKHIVIVGGGVMGSILFSLIRRIRPNARLTVCVGDDGRYERFTREGATVTRDDEACGEADVVVLAIKPKDFLASNISAKPSALVISVMAGVSIAAIRRTLGASRVARIMTNTAAEFGKAYALWLAPGCTTLDTAFIRALCAACGTEREVSTEAAIDRATVILGSGPAFLLRALEQFDAASRSLGLSREEARAMTASAFEAVYALQARERDTAALVKRIASKGGTTEAGLEVFEKAKGSKTWQRAFRAAYTRARALRKSVSS